MSFARNFALGQDIAQRGIDTFRDARQRRDLGRIADAKPEELDGYTRADGELLERLSDPKRTPINPETGQPYYDIQDNGQGGLQVRNNFSYAGQDGQMVAPGSATGLQTRKVTDFLGQRHDGALDADKIDRLRYGAMADVVAKGDPMAGMRIRRELKQDEREDQRAKRDDWRFGREQTTAAREDDEVKFTETMRTGMSDFMNQRLVGPDGQRRDPTPEDAVAAIQHQAALFAKNGRPEMAAGAMKDYLQVASAQIQMQTAERKQVFGRAAAAAINGDMGPMVEAFNKFVPDGTRVIDYQVGKDGKVTVKRETLDGQKLPDAKLDGGVEELVVALQSFDDPGALLSWSQQQFKNSLDLEKLGLDRTRTNAAVNSARQPKEASPETIRAINELSVQIMNSEDPTERARLMGNLRVLQSQAATEMNKPVNLSGLADPRGVSSVQTEWAAIEKELYKNASSPADIDAARDSFMASRGVAPPRALAELQSGTNPKTRKPWTRQDYEAFNRRFPLSAVKVPDEPAAPPPPPPANTGGRGVAPPRSRYPVKEPAPAPASAAQRTRYFN